MAADVKRAARPYASSLRQHQAELTRRKILDAALTLFVDRGFPAVTVQDIALEAGVSYQTVYAQFGNKLNVALELCGSELPHVGPTVAMLQGARPAADPEAALRLLATFARRLYEPCAEILRFMRQSGDAELLGRYAEIQRGRLHHLADFGPALERSRRLRPGLGGRDAVDIAWSLTAPDTYEGLVLERGWTPDRFELWLGDALTTLLLAGG